MWKCCGHLTRSGNKIRPDLLSLCVRKCTYMIFFHAHSHKTSPICPIFMVICVFCQRVTFFNWPLVVHRTSQEHLRAGSKWCHASKWPPTPWKLASFIMAHAQGQSIGKHDHYGSKGAWVARWQANYPIRCAGRCLPAGSYIFKVSVHTSFVFIRGEIICLNIRFIGRNKDSAVFIVLVNLHNIYKIWSLRTVKSLLLQLPKTEICFILATLQLMASTIYASDPLFNQFYCKKKH